MRLKLLPDDFDELLGEAVAAFWTSRRETKPKSLQGGSRDAVVSGKNMDGFVHLVRSIVTHCGLPDSALHCGGSGVVLPGFFRATKNWDALIIHQRRLLAVLEFKSQAGSFGNNINNRCEEVIGSAADLWVAHYHKAFSDEPRLLESRISEPLEVGAPESLLHPDLMRDPRPPFLAWVMLLEDCPGSRSPVSVREPHFKVFDEFRDASYATRYQLLCERLVQRRLYAAAALALSPRDSSDHTALSDATSLHNLFRELAARLLAAGG